MCLIRKKQKETEKKWEQGWGGGAEGCLGEENVFKVALEERKKKRTPRHRVPSLFLKFCERPGKKKEGGSRGARLDADKERSLRLSGGGVEAKKISIGNSKILHYFLREIRKEKDYKDVEWMGKYTILTEVRRKKKREKVQLLAAARQNFNGKDSCQRKCEGGKRVREPLVPFPWIREGGR